MNDDYAADWRRIRLGDVCGIVSGQVDPTLPDYCDLPHVNGTRIESGTGRLLEIRSAAEDGMTSGKYLFEAGDVLYSKLRPYLRKVAIAETRGLCSADMYPLRPRDGELDPTFLLYLLLSDGFTDYADEESRRSRMPKLNRNQLFAWEAALPPLAEQRRIAGLLRERLGTVERAREAAVRQHAAAQALPAAFLRDVFDHGRHAWEQRPLGEVCNLLPSKSIATAGDCEVDAITTACLTEEGFDPNGVKKARMWAKDVEPCTVSEGEILIARSNTAELVGRVSLVPQVPQVPRRWVASDLTIRVAVGDEIRPQYLATYLSHLYVTGHWRRRAGGASDSMKKITRSQLKAHRMPIPPPSEQVAIASAAAENVNRLRGLKSLVGTQLHDIEALPAAMLREAFQGRL